MNKVITLDLVIENVIFTQQCFVLLITNLIILGSDFLDTHFTVLDIGNHIITLHCTDYMLTNSLNHDPLHNYNLAKIVAPAATEVSYMKFRKEMQRDTLIYIDIVQHCSKFPLPLSL